MKIGLKEIIKKILQDCLWLLIVLITIFQLWNFHSKIRKNRSASSENLVNIRITNQNETGKQTEFQNLNLIF